MPVLKQLLPPSFLDGRYDDTPAFALRDAQVIGVRRTDPPCDTTSELYAPWPGPQRHVRAWFILKGGKAVGIDEDQEAGPSFPVVDYTP